jgi:dTDP-glucose pyrophosphorylase
MIKNELKYYLIQKNQSIKTALEYLNFNRDKCLVIINKNKKLLGTLTDGDIRRAILNGKDFSQSIKNIFNRRPYSLVTNGTVTDVKIRRNLIKEYKVIPIVNKSKKLLNVISLTSNNYSKNVIPKIPTNKHSIPVVIMAGGEGRRLLPHTSVIPKPLIPYKGKSMIEHVTENFKNFGFNHFTITLNYKSDLMKAFFSSNKQLGKFKFIFEKKPLGTAGSLLKIKKSKFKNFFVINCDSILNFNYESFLNYHLESQHDITLVVCKKTQTFKYGSCIISQTGKLKKIYEKPKVSLLANTGLYLVNSKIINLIKKNEKIDMNSLIERAINYKFKVGVFPIHESEWQDLGTWLDFEKNSN